MKQDMLEVVEKMLSESESARNNDHHLILRTLKHLGYPIEFTQEGGVFRWKWEILVEMPSFESITRCRRIIQNEQGKWPPTNPTVIFERKLNEERMFRWCIEHKERQNWERYKRLIYTNNHRFYFENDAP